MRQGETVTDDHSRNHRPHRNPQAHRPHRPNRPGNHALVLGILALVCALLPIIGGLMSPPFAILAVIFGSIGLREHKAGRARRVFPAAAGAVLGVLALGMAIVAVFAMAG